MSDNQLKRNKRKQNSNSTTSSVSSEDNTLTEQELFTHIDKKIKKSAEGLYTRLNQGFIAQFKQLSDMIQQQSSHSAASSSSNSNDLMAQFEAASPNVNVANQLNGTNHLVTPVKSPSSTISASQLMSPSQSSQYKNGEKLPKQAQIQKINKDTPPPYDPSSTTFQTFQQSLNLTLASFNCLNEAKSPLPAPIQLRSMLSDKGFDLTHYQTPEINEGLTEKCRIQLINSQAAYNIILAVMTRSHMPPLVKELAKIVPPGNAFELYNKFSAIMSVDEIRQREQKQHQFNDFVPGADEPLSNAALRMFYLVEELSRLNSTTAGDVHHQFKLFTHKLHQHNHREYGWFHTNESLFFIPGVTTCMFDVATKLKAAQGYSEVLPTRNKNSKGHHLPAETPALHTDVNPAKRKPSAQQSKPQQQAKTPDQLKCSRCDQLGHPQRDCKNTPIAGRSQCTHCKMYGHLVDKCRKKQPSKAE